AATRSFSVDKTTPIAPVIQTPTSGASVGIAGTAFIGTAEANSTVTVRVDGTVIGTPNTDVDGNWSLPTNTSLAEGTRTMTVTATDAAGNTGPAATRSFSVDKTAPIVPVIQTPAEGALVGTAGTAFIGTAEANSTVTVRVDGTVISAPKATADGAWALPINTTLPEGPLTLTVTATDGAGNTGPTATRSFTVDRTAPIVPVIQTPASGASVGIAGTAFEGTAEANSTVTVRVDGTAIGTPKANADGEWSLPTRTTLAAGNRTMTVTATDGAGNTSPTATRTFSVDKTAPIAPVIQTPVAGALVGTTGTAFDGTAEPNSTVTVRVDGTVIGAPRANAAGEWALPTSTTLPEGPLTMTVTATDGAGNTGPAAERSFTVDTSPPPIPVISVPANNAVVARTRPDFSGTAEVGSRVSIFIDGLEAGPLTVSDTGAWAYTPATALTQARHDVQVRATDLAGNVGDLSSARSFRVDTTLPISQVSAPAQNETLTTATPRISGTSEAESTIFIRLDGAALANVTVDGAGNWSYAPTAPFAHGQHAMQVNAVDLAGNVGPTIVRNFTLDLELPGKPALLGPANASLVNTRTPLIRGTAQQNCILTVRLDGLPQDQKPVVDSAGEWKHTPTTALSDGLHLVSAYCTDGFGRASAESDSHAFTVDTTPPAAPLVVTPTADAIVGPGFDTLTGTAEPGTTLTATLNGLPVGTTQANERGEWAVKIGLTIISGPQNLLVRATDVAGNTGAASTPRAFIVDVLPPTTVLSGGPIGTSTLSQVTFTLTPSETVAGFKCTLDGVDLTPCESPLTVRSLAEGVHTLDVVATDLAGNVQLTPAHHQWNVIRPSTVEGGGVGGCSSAAGALPLGLVWLAWVGLLGLRRRR
ncbi:Ig-like domain-containing protein, partial [Corallococcus terminator]